MPIIPVAKWVADNPQSTFSKVNCNEDVALDKIFTEAFNRSMELAKKTKGVFYPTGFPLINLWGFGFEDMEEPSDSLVNEKWLLPLREIIIG